MTQIVDVMLAEADELHEEKQGTLSFEDCVGSVLPKHPASVAMELLKRYHVDLEEEAQTQSIRVLDEQEALRCMNFSDAPDLCTGSGRWRCSWRSFCARKRPIRCSSVSLA